MHIRDHFGTQCLLPLDGVGLETHGVVYLYTWRAVDLGYNYLLDYAYLITYLL